MLDSKPRRSITCFSTSLGFGILVNSERIFTLQVVHLPFPPQEDACGMLPSLLASSTE